MSVLKCLYKKWITMGEWISRIINPILLFVIFFAIIVPLALVFKILRRDELSLRLNPKAETHWKSVDNQPPSLMEKQY